ncbi:MAG: hypothetical protein J7K26_01360, partial [Candidatus Aenigmarchaeota archaeon]|nr:hypothetical protein [Candidatus Aenigmarchaeota archaeon]
ISFKNKKIFHDFLAKINEKRNKITITGLLSFFFISLLFKEMLLLSLSILGGTLLFVFYIYVKIVEKSFYKRISVKKLKVDDMIGEDIPKINIYKQRIRGLTKDEIKRIKKYRKYVIVREGIRYSPVFAISLIITLIYGDILFTLLV